MQNAIRFVQRRESTYILDEQFEFRRDGKHPWLQRACFWILRKLGANAIGKHSEHITVEPDKVVDSLLRQRHELIMMHNYEPCTVLMGAEDYAELVNNRDVPLSYFGFSGNSENCRPTVAGLQVEVVPWMRGVIVMPSKTAALRA